GKAPRYPFGYGLSYTEFEYSALSVVQCGMHQFRVSFDITNTGKTDGWEVAQVYVCDPDSSVPRPEKELKGYEKVFVPKGGTVRVEIILDEDAFSFYDTLSGGFVVEPGTFIIKAGPSSAELPLECEIAI
ncbi:MAG: fibronectin type III-like domain-contianing protein, partial [Bacteroidales bacterium]|nr:fibronectin type III-like domain-contianing protein [Bacteroidales bacterium]